MRVLQGGRVEARDLRGAAALVVGALAAEGTTIIDDGCAVCAYGECQQLRLHIRRKSRIRSCTKIIKRGNGASGNRGRQAAARGQL